MRGSPSIVAAALLAIVTGGLAAKERPGDLSAYRWKARLLLVLAPDAQDPRVAKQRALFEAMHEGARERDLKLVEVVGNTAEGAALRQRFDVNGAAFQAILIGKDGGDKLSSAEPIGPDALFPLIDSMPMRQQEMTERP